MPPLSCERQRRSKRCPKRMPCVSKRALCKYVWALMTALVILALLMRWRSMLRQHAMRLLYYNAEDGAGNDLTGNDLTGNDLTGNDLTGIDPPTEQPRPAKQPSIWMRDWHDYAAMERDAQRQGFGEQGKPAKLPSTLRSHEKELSLEHGFNALLSDSISVNRSVPDTRHLSCHVKQYYAKLPTVSVIIPVYNEHLSVLLRSVHSLVNRSPRHLLKEIILVDDFSSRASLHATLERYVEQHLPIVKIVRLPKRTGLIGARLAGARIAKARVLVFVDSHIEANHNWLPPLLELIAQNKRNVVCPFIDVIDDKTFAYTGQDEGARGVFDWNFDYKRLELLPQDLVDMSRPFRSPVMAGGLFAISKEFFWELGGYDEGLDVWGGEQYELSFKIWMCGGEMFDAPCSRVGHIYRGEITIDDDPPIGDYVHRNYKRVAEVWMDGYKKYLYKRNAKAYAAVDAGDLSKQKALRKRLHCKSFKWFLENVAFDLKRVYPPVEPPDYAYGAIQSLAAPGLCVDTMSTDPEEVDPIGLFTCARNLKNPHASQDWALTWHRDLRLRSEVKCLDVEGAESSAALEPDESVEQVVRVVPVDCHGQGGNQMWYYDADHNWLTQGHNGELCLEAMPSQGTIVLNMCSENNSNMRWKFSNINYTALETYYDGIPEDNSE